MFRKISSILFLIYCSAILFISLMPWPVTSYIGYGKFQIRLDYLEHLGAFLVFGFLFVLRYYRILLRKEISELNTYLIAGICICFVSEIIQYFFPQRAFSFIDFLSNSMGVVLIYLIYTKFHKWLLSTSNEIQSKY
ncbi:MAG: VanZ family protein [Bacteroidales bacterium]